MDNWDYFKENLNVANNSQGTLDTQASIYAESWMAASDRVRASWEGLWDSFINSDSFITITVNGREYNIDRLQRVKTHANIDDSICYHTLVAKDY